MKNPIEIIAKISKAPDFSPGDIAALMQKLGLNEKGFGLVMNVSPFTIKMWITGATQPRSAASRLLQLYKTRPACINALVDEES